MIVASPCTKTAKRLNALPVALAAGALLGSVSQAGAVSSQVRYACAGDYLSYCSSFAPDSADTRRCMRTVGYKLSKGCVAALISAGEVSKTEVARRSASQR
jgi:hypothetical protein